MRGSEGPGSGQGYQADTGAVPLLQASANVHVKPESSTCAGTSELLPLPVMQDQGTRLLVPVGGGVLHVGAAACCHCGDGGYMFNFVAG